MSAKLTAEQEAAIAARGRVLVSASAGSGKTFVMIERLLSLILGGADVRRVLAVTFTNKAAAQMRERLRAAMIDRIGRSGEEERRRLKEQLSYLPLADISTIHAFCARLLRASFFLAGIDAAFRIISPDDAEGKLLARRALDEVLEEAYAEKSEGFSKLLAIYFRRSDAKLRELVLSVYRGVRGRTDYREALSSAGQKEEFAAVCDYLAADVRERASFLAARARELSEKFGGEEKRDVGARRTLAGTIAAAEALKGDLFALRDVAAVPPEIARMPSSAGAEGAVLARLKEAGRLSAEVKALYKELLGYAPREEEFARYLDGQETARALGGLVLSFDDVYSRLKREAGVLDYDDLEHLSLGLLRDEKVRASLADRYEYVFVDEYQDVNPAQEELLSLLGGKDVFLVGDAKQSIYAFRGSRSEFFLAKEKEFSALSLTENFRSSPAVLEAVNRVFSYAMTERSAGLSYRAAPMRGGARYGEHEGLVRFHTVSAVKEEREKRGVYSVLTPPRRPRDAQAERIADLVEEEVGSEWFDADEGLMKPLTFGDIAVLARKGSGDAEKIVAALSERDIPVTTTATVNVCDFWEGRLVIDWLSFLDNGEQDIPLAGAMLSRAGGLTDGDLARVRLRFPSPYTFRAACREYCRAMRDDLSAKLNAFFARAENYRYLMQVRTAAEMIDLLLADGLEAEIAGRKDGTARLKRVRRLQAEAEGSVNDFLRRLNALSYRVDFAESGGDGAVKVLTMHASKGLEYPVVILASLGAHFHSNEREDVLLTDAFLLAPRSYDLGNKLVRETVLRRASALYESREDVKGELNLLYVAMTRAKYRLHLLFADRERALAPEYAERFSDFIDLTACADYFEEEPPRRREPLPRSALAYRADEEILSALRSVYRRPYSHEESTRLPVKSSATALIKEADAEAKAPHGRSAGASTVEEGLAYHAFLEKVHFGRSAGEELRRMRGEGALTEEQLALLDEDKLEAILALPSLRGLSSAHEVLREQTFLLSLPASAIPSYRTGEEDAVVLQGAIDLLCLDDEGYLILDYKYSSRGAEALKEHYAPQIELYRKAVAAARGVDASRIRARILNVRELFEVEM